MKTYTKKQLIDAMHEYNKDYADNPNNFTPNNEMDYNDIQVAKDQIEYLIKKVK